MGGGDGEVTATTTDLLIEAAHFDPITVARSARRHQLPSEAAKRFERGADPPAAAGRGALAVALLVEHGGGTADAGVTDVDRRERGAAVRLRRWTCRPARRAGRTRRTRCARPCARSAARSPTPVPTARHGAAAVVAARPRRGPSTWSRRSRGCAATTRSRRCCRSRGGRARADPRPAGPALDRARPGRAGSRRGAQLPVRRHRPARPARPARRRRRVARRAAGQPAVRRAAADAHQPAGHPARHRAAQRQPAGRATWRSSSSGWSPAAGAAPPARRCPGVEPGPTTHLAAIDAGRAAAAAPAAARPCR